MKIKTPRSFETSANITIGRNIDLSYSITVVVCKYISMKCVVGQDSSVSLV